MITKDILWLVDRFQGLEFHAAHSGREVLRVLVKTIDESQQTTVSGIADELHENIKHLLRSLPPYAPPLNSINRVLLFIEKSIASDANVFEMKSQLGALSAMTANPQKNQETIADYLIDVLPRDAVVYTHTLSETVLGVLLELHRRRKISQVIVTESRPNNDGWDTARRLAEQKLKVQLTIDAAMPAAIENAHLMLSGAEVIRPDGSVVGKIGAYPAALFCQEYAKPLYIISDSNKISYIPWDGYFMHEITHKALGLDYSNTFLQVTGSYFDITPAYYISGYATEQGIMDLETIQTVVAGMEVSSWLANQISKNTMDKIQEDREEREK